jgi:hypothetical protein
MQMFRRPQRLLFLVVLLLAFQLPNLVVCFRISLATKPLSVKSDVRNLNLNLHQKTAVPLARTMSKKKSMLDSHRGRVFLNKENPEKKGGIGRFLPRFPSMRRSKESPPVKTTDHHHHHQQQQPRNTSTSQQLGLLRGEAFEVLDAGAASRALTQQASRGQGGGP